MPLHRILDVSITSLLGGSAREWSTRGDRLLQLLRAYERELWLLTLGAMLVDVTLTVHGLQLGLRELNPVGRAALDVAGILGLYALKGVALGLGVSCVLLIPRKFRPLVPLGLAIPSVLAVLINTVVISVTLFWY